MSAASNKLALPVGVCYCHRRQDAAVYVRQSVSSWRRGQLMLRWIRGIMVAVLGILAFLRPAIAQEGSSPDPFRLFTSCAPVAYTLQVQTDDRALTEEALAPTVSSRLRVARIHGGRLEEPGPPAHAILVVTIHTVSHSFHVSLQLRKPVYDEASGQYGAAVTWQRSATGGGPERAHIMEALLPMLDLFVDEYLRVNARACT